MPTSPPLAFSGLNCMFVSVAARPSTLVLDSPPTCSRCDRRCRPSAVLRLPRQADFGRHIVVGTVRTQHDTFRQHDDAGGNGRTGQQLRTGSRRNCESRRRFFSWVHRAPPLNTSSGRILKSTCPNMEYVLP